MFTKVESLFFEFGMVGIYRQPGQVRTCGASRNGVGQVGTEAFTALFGDLSQIKSYPVESIDLFYNI